MARTPAPAEEIVFDDLHGVADDDDTIMEVDLDAKDDAITRRARTSSDDGTRTDDDQNFDPLNKRVAGDSHTDDDGDETRGRGNVDDDDEGGDKFSKKFQGRLDRERRSKRREATRADEAEADNARLRKQLKKQNKNSHGDETAELDRQISATETDLVQAIEDGKSKDQVRLTGTLTDLKARRIAADYTRDNDDDDDLDDDPDAGRRQPRSNPLVAEWKESHSDWYGRPGFERQTRIANRLDREVHADGFDQSDDEYFDELDKRLKKKHPEVFEKSKDDDDDDDDKDAGRRNPRDRKRDNKDKGRSPVASADDASRDGDRSKQNRNKVELGAADFANMRRFGLDPDKAAHVKEYALNKRQLAEEDS